MHMCYLRFREKTKFPAITNILGVAKQVSQSPDPLELCQDQKLSPGMDTGFAVH